MSTLIQDVKYGLRQLRRNPVYTAVAILTLALGIGANTAIFTLVDSIMLKSLPVVNPGELYRVGTANNCCVQSGNQGNWDLYSYDLYTQLSDHTPEFSQMAAFQAALSNLSVRRRGASGAAEPYLGEFVSGNYFSMFGISAYAGRAIMPADDQPNALPVAVMDYRTWQTHFGSDTSVIGSSFVINMVPYTVVGITPPAFFGDTLRSDPPDFWLPLSTEPVLNGQNSILKNPGLHWLHVIGRLKPGAKPAAVQTEVTTELQRWLSGQPDLTAYDRSQLSKQHIVIGPGGEGVASMQDQAHDGLRLLMIIAGLVLLIACANIANLLLARAASKRYETAVRVALGAPRRRLVRQILTESVLLAVMGGVAGLLVAYLGTRTLLLIAFRGAHYVPINATPSLAVLGFAFLLSLLTGVVFGAAPAWITSHSDPAEALRGAGRSTRDRSSLPRKSLVVIQVALSIVLLIGAGLLTISLRNLEDQNFGFEPQGRLIVRVNPALAGYKPDQLHGLYQQLDQQLSQIPGVISASYSIYSPMRGDNWGFGFHILGRPPDERDGASFDCVGPHYFETIGTRLVRGRLIGEQDTPASPKVAVVNQAFAKKFFPKQDPIGQHFGLGDPSHAGDMELVGIVQDAKYQSAHEPPYPTFFTPFFQMPNDPKLEFLKVAAAYIGDIELHVAGQPENLEEAVRRTLANINPNLTILDMMSLNRQLELNFNQENLIVWLTELFGLLALVLACVGLYGVTSYSVARRTSEIGLRMALGASRANVLRLVLRGAMFQLAIGLAVGIPLALAGGRLVSTMLYGVKSYNVWILLAAAIVLTACAFVAAYFPARRAARVDPLVALRYE
ncbi:MAG: ABC transporter permease [Acidobacteria bacterium]|nr:MAG: ABC transporter permease [Acidobacteriota bacterium]